MGVEQTTVEQIIKTIQDNSLQQGFFYGEDFEDYFEDFEEDTLEEYLESLGLPKEFKRVQSREDTSEFWSVIHFPVEDIYLKFTGTYDSYGQYEHDYDTKVTQVFPKQETVTVYAK